MSNEAKILITEQGAKQTQAAIEQTGAAAKKMGADVDKGATEAAKGNEKINKSAKETHGHFSKMHGLLDSLTLGFANMIMAGLGIGSLVKLITSLNDGIRKTIELNTEAANSMKTPLELGQKMVFQTDTGSQEGWAAKILKLQAKAGFGSPSTASELMTGVDVAFTQQGGISNPKIMEMTEAIAPDIAAMMMSDADASKLIKFSQVAGVTDSLENYRAFFSKIRTAYKTSNSTDPGQFLTGLQSGATSYIKGGGSVDQAIANYSAILDVSKGEQVGAEMFRRMFRLANTGSGKLHETMGEAYGVPMDNLSIDQKYRMMMNFVGSLPAQGRAKFLTDIGVSDEFATELSTISSPEVTKKTGFILGNIKKSSAESIASLSDTWQKSSLARMNKTEAEIQSEKLNADVGIAQANKKARAVIENRRMRGETSFWLTDEQEYSRAFADILAEQGGYESTKSGIPGPASLQKQSAVMQQNIMEARKDPDHKSPRGITTFNPISPFVEGWQMTKNMGPVIINYNYDRSRSSGPAYTQDE